MVSRSKRYDKAAALVDRAKTYEQNEAIDLLVQSLPESLEAMDNQVRRAGHLGAAPRCCGRSRTSRSRRPCREYTEYRFPSNAARSYRTALSRRPTPWRLNF